MAVYFYCGMNTSVHLICKTDEEYKAMKIIYKFTITENYYTTTLLTLDSKRKKGEFFPVHAMKAYRGSRHIVSLILNLGTRWRCVFNFTPRPPYPPPPGRKRCYPSNRRLGGPKSWSGRFYRRENLLPKQGFESRTIQCVASRIPTTLFWFLTLCVMQNHEYPVNKDYERGGNRQMQGPVPAFKWTE
jgi:hypothetical protein